MINFVAVMAILLTSFERLWIWLGCVKKTSAKIFAAVITQTVPEGCYVEGCVKKSRFLTSISLCIQHMTMVTVEDEYAICDLLNSTIFSDREWPLRQISTIRHYLPLNIAEREQGRYTVTRDYTH